MSKSAIFDREEEEVLKQLLPAMEKRSSHSSAAIRQSLAALRQLADTLASFAPLDATEQLRHHVRSQETLVKKLLRQDHIQNTLYIPSQVVIGQSFVHAKISFLLMLKYSIAGNLKLKKSAPKLVELITANIFHLMTEDVLQSLVEDRTLSIQTREKAVQRLLSLWSSRTEPLDSMSVPTLISMWKARQRLFPVFGSMMGLSEIYQISRFVDPLWFDFLTVNENNEEVFQALEEFIFNLSHEEILRVREEMELKKMSVITKKKIELTVGRSQFCPDMDKVDPRELMRYYKERKQRAEQRMHAGLPGPKRTVEEFLVLFLLEKAQDQAKA